MSDVEPPAHPAGVRAQRPAAVRRGKRRAPKRRAPKQRTHVIAKVIVSTMLSLALLTGLSVVFLYRHFSDNVTTIPTTLADPTHRPVKVEVEGPKEPLNILVMGDDTRDGKGNGIDGEAGGGSDTTMLLHLSANRKRAYGISIPRDTMVDRPECKTEDGDITPEQTYAQWNEAYGLAGPGCTLEQFEKVTGIRVDHFVVVDFNGFKGMVDAVGGVDVCVPEEIDDEEHGIVIPAGNRKIEGDEALSYVRVRHGVGDGSDLSRIKRQQAFVASMAAAAVSSKTLANPWRLFRFLDAATKSLTTDDDLKLVELANIGAQFRGIGLDNIKFITAPIAEDPNDVNRVVLTDAANALWRKIIHDRTLTRNLLGTTIRADDVPTTSPSSDPSASPSDDPTASDSSSPSASPSESEAKQERDNELARNGLCT